MKFSEEILRRDDVYADLSPLHDTHTYGSKKKLIQFALQRYVSLDSNNSSSKKTIRIVEIGAYRGEFTNEIANACTELAADYKCAIIAIDIWNGIEDDAFSASIEFVFLYYTTLISSSYVHEANAKVEYEVEHVFNASASIQAKKHSVAIFSYILDADEYDVAIESVACYAILRNYTYLLIFENDYWLQKCPQGHIYFRRHCVVQYFLDQYDHILVIDSDVGIVNPHREIEEWIDPSFDLIFYERLFSKEVSTSSFIIRNSNFSRMFLNTLLGYADKGFSGKLSGDNPAIHAVMVELFAPYAKDELAQCLHIWGVATTYKQLFAFEACLWLIIGKRRQFGQNAMILKRGRAWVRDAYMTNSSWSFKRDFMFHNWKRSYMRLNDNVK
uniref:Methyltransferase domain-containing protein n=1 Tax=Ascaris lumbricoides TaxID=6252 RepID=A0A9J2PU69_ASCLU